MSPLCSTPPTPVAPYLTQSEMLCPLCGRQDPMSSCLWIPSLSLSIAVCAWNILPPDVCRVQPHLSGLFKHHFISEVFSNHPVKRTPSTTQSFDLSLCFFGALDLLCIYQFMCLLSSPFIILLTAISSVLSTAAGTVRIWWMYEGIDPNMLDRCFPFHQIPSLWLVVFALLFFPHYSRFSAKSHEEH